MIQGIDHLVIVVKDLIKPLKTMNSSASPSSLVDSIPWAATMC